MKGDPDSEKQGAPPGTWRSRSLVGGREDIPRGVAVPQRGEGENIL